MTVQGKGRKKEKIASTGYMQNKLVVGAGEEGCCWGKNEGAGKKMEKGGWGKGVNYIKNRLKCLKFASSD